MTKVGFIGLGNMGLPMVRNLLAAGHEVKCYVLVADTVARAADAGGTVAASPEDAGTDVNIVVTMLPEGRHTLAVYEGSEIFKSAAPGTIFVDCSSIDVASAKRAHELAESAGFKSLDAPVSGGVSGAEAGTLTLMIGGDSATLDAVRPTLDAVAGRLILCGGPGAGQTAKMCNQMMVAANMAVCCEAFALAERLGLDAKTLYDVVNTSSGQSFAMSGYIPVPGIIETGRAEHDFAPGFTTALLLKDVNIFQSAAAAAGMASPVGAHVAKLYEDSIAAGNADKDYSVIIEHLRSLAKD